MKYLSRIAVIAAFATLSACSQNEEFLEQENAVETQTQLTDEEHNLIPGVVNIKFDELNAQAAKEAAVAGIVATKSPGINMALQSIGAYSIQPLFDCPEGFEARHHEFGLDQWFVVRYDDKTPLTKASVSLQEMEGVEEVEIPRKIKRMGHTYFNDTYRTYQWGIQNNGTEGTAFTKGADINVVKVWQEFTAGSSDVIVAVVDGGIRLTHQDLSAVTIAGGSDGSKNFVDNSYTITGDDHGCNVASIIGAVSNNSRGVSGVAGGKDGKGGVKLLSCQIFAGEKSGPGASAITWAADHGAVICNNSWGYSYDTEDDAKKSSLPSSVKSAVDYFNKYAGCDKNGNQVGKMKGGLCIFAAGNDGWQYAQPAPYTGVMAVGAMAPDFKRAYTDTEIYSNWGDWVDICAPGGAYLASDGNDGKRMIIGAATSSDSAYIFMAGTSQACPYVSGVAALLVSYYGGMGFTREELWERLINGANYDHMNMQDHNIGPLVDAYGAFTVLGNGDGTAPEIAVSINGKQIKDGEEVKLKSHESVAGKVSFTGGTDGYAVSVSKGSDALTYKAEADGSYELQIDALQVSPATYTATITAGFGSKSRNVFSFKYTVEANHAPVAVKEQEDVVLEKKGSSVSLNVAEMFTDADGEKLTYAVTVDNDNLATAEIKNGVLSIEAWNFGKALVSVTASDARKAQANVDFNLAVVDPATPAQMYPNPVEKQLSIHKGAKKEFTITLYSSAGGAVKEIKTEGSIFQPAVIDMTGFAPGQYVVKLAYEGKEEKQVIVKK